ncbi:uncharacterized protein TRAVEDRAFT_43879 [Trametes versicolor FP-101664 SS1]|uniref:uncharacterized protein n=1 Tax=Trametes versicolor (strain FP-101664) TaxID=717944 RepID=UPI00046244A5|nr:uncharacterized protein TRAVEDRAFT_43879 [Trametes versicolor FP-101664 SS1]EIW63592.1 hypothetical protein TRAVEDRAFT_43879 [Trametes versicolor FP-101664 SS1]
MVAQADKRLLWHPRGQNKFVVGGSTQITLYEWLPQSSQIKQVASQLELNTMKCFAWSPDPVLDDLVAVGFGNGRVDLLRLEASKHARSGVLSHGPAVSLPARNTRACNALAFSSEDPSYLAVGLDKVRNDPSLLIWDIQSASPMLSINTASPVESISRPLPYLPRTDSRASDSRIIQQHAPVENVSTLAWLPRSSHLLLAGVSHRWLQLFDLRNPSSGPTKAASKVQGIATDPFDEHRVACFGDAIVSIWDTRRFTQPVLTFTARDASADGVNGTPTGNTGARGKSNTPASAATHLTHVEFSSTRRGTLATLERDADYVRFWDVVQAQFAEPAVETSRSRDSSQSGGKAVRSSWVKSWSTSGSAPSQSSMPPPPIPSNDVAQYNLILADTRRTKTFSRPFASFALVSSSKSHPLTSNVMLVNKDGDLELYAVHDTPVHPAWSARGDLALGVGCSYTVVPGITDMTRPLEPWEILAYPSRPGSHAQSLERPDFGVSSFGGRRSRLQSESPSHSVPPPTFGRGDEEGFPALSPPPTKPAGDEPPSRSGRRRTHSPSALKQLHFEHTATGKTRYAYSSQGKKHRGDQDVQPVHFNTSMPTPRTVTLALDDGEVRAKPTRKSGPLKALQHVVETDISMVMRQRAIKGYGLVYPLHNSAVARDTSPDGYALSELWLWVHHAQRLLSSPSPMIEGYNFAYQGLIGIWESFRPTRPHPSSNQPTPRMARSALFDGPAPSPKLTALSLEVPHRSSSKQSGGRKRSRPPASALPDDFVGAIEELNARSGNSESVAAWKPSVGTARLAQRRFALQLCAWSLAHDDLARAIKRWEKENRHSQAACWLVFTEQNKQAVELLMRSKDESHHMMSGMVAALTSGGSRNTELVQHCERLIVRLQDPYLRALLTHLTVRDWAEVLEEDSLPLRERLAIALQFLDDKEVSAYLRRVSDRCIHDGDIDGIFVTGLTNSGMDLLQAYLDLSGDVQTAALLSVLPPSRAQDARAGRWLNSYRDLLDGWRLFHHRCQIDIDRGHILKEAIENAEIRALEWAPRQLLLRCNYCGKPMDPPFPADGHLRVSDTVPALQPALAPVLCLSDDA